MPMSTCSACSFELDPTDNFCRSCGAAVGQPGLPAVRSNMSATVWRPQASPVVKGAAVMAAGTVGQFVFRRIVRNLVSGGARNRSRRALRVRGDRDGMVDEAQIITETIMMRRVRIRRQA